MFRENYFDCAKKHEAIFRLILEQYGKQHEGLTIEQLYEKYSEGERYGIRTILNFTELKPNVFEFSSEDISFLSGRGSTEKVVVQGGKLKSIKTQISWMS
jgi:hypothetical protein